jgi:hypothetical protein
MVRWLLKAREKVGLVSRSHVDEIGTKVGAKTEL